MLSRANLKAMGLEPEQVEKILDLHGASMEGAKENAKEKARQAEEANQAKIAELESELSKARSELKATKDDDGSFEAKLNAEIEAHKITKSELETAKAEHKKAVDGYEKEKDDATVDSLVKTLLGEGDESNGKMHPSAIDKALRMYDRSLVKRDKDGKIKNADEVLAHFATEWKDFFGKETTRGVDTGKPPESQSTAYTKEAIAKMSVDEINQNWDAVKASLNGGN